MGHHYNYNIVVLIIFNYNIVFLAGRIVRAHKKGVVTGCVTTPVDKEGKCLVATAQPHAHEIARPAGGVSSGESQAAFAREAIICASRCDRW
jgi:8-oxo-dGTP pyrophosphatase MutT (NUDIX family)